MPRIQVACGAKKFCWMLDLALEGSQKPGRGMDVETMFNFKTGEIGVPVVIYRCKGPRGKILILKTCPFCGVSILPKKNAARKKTS
jgi:hypothetical protein